MRFEEEDGGVKEARRKQQRLIETQRLVDVPHCIFVQKAPNLE
jgi:hypothetical protein